jgi:hypothetical protein
MNNEFTRMQKLAGLITENTVNKDLSSIIDDVYNYFTIEEPTSTSDGRRKYIEITYNLSDADTDEVMMDVSNRMRDEDAMGMEEGIGAYEYEKGKEAGEKIEKEKMTKSKLRDKIREMVLAEMDGAVVEAEYYDPVDEAKKKKEDEDIDVEDVEIDTETPDVEMDEDAEINNIQDLLDQLQDAVEQLGDEKLLKQIGNTITFFTRQHVADKPELNEMLSSDYIDRMEGLADAQDLNILKVKLRILTSDWMNEGFDKEDVIDYIEVLINEI